MALVLQDRVRETSSTTGTGTISLGGAYTGYRTFSSCVPTGSVVYYCIQNTTAGYDTEWEVGYGTYTSAGNTLSRTTVYSSSNAGALVPFSSPASLNVFITQPAEQAIYQEINGDLRLVGGVIGLSEDGTQGTTLPNTSFQAFVTGDFYMQANQQNLSNGSSASSDWVSTADNGSDTDNFMDVGMASSGYNYPEFGAQDANSGYIISTGENLQLVAGKYGANVAAANASATDIVFVAGDLLKSGIRGTIKGDTGNWIIGPYGTTDTGQKLQVTGNAAVTGVTNFSTYVYSGANVAAAANSTVLTTKEYVDASASTAFVVHPSVVYATAAVLPNSPTYNNGTSGVGANLVATTNGTLVIDGVTLTSPADVGIRVLVKSQANAAHNGCYTVTAVGGPSATWELTRSTDFDTAGAGEIANNAYFYVTAGDTQIGSSWILSQLSAITVGTTNLPFSLFASPIGYTVESPLQLDGTTLSLAGVVDVAHGGTNIASYTTGDLVYASGTTTLSKRAISSNTGAALIVSGGVPNWGTIDLSSSNAVSATLGSGNGGTGFSTYTLGDLIYSSATNTLSKLAGQTTTTKKYLSQTGTGTVSAAPSWDQVAAADISGLAPSATTDTSNATNITSGTLPTGRLSGSYTGVTGVGTLTAGTWTANVVGTTYGGTGAAGTLSGLVYGNGASAMSAASAAQVVAVIGSTAVANATYAVSANSATYSSNLIGGLAGSIPYQSAANTTVLLATGSGVLVGGSTPAWSTAPTLTGTNFSGIPNSATTASAANGASTIVARDISGGFAAGAVTVSSVSGSGAGLTTLNASNLSSGTIGSSILGNSSVYIGTTAVALNRGSGAISLTGTSIDGSAGSATTATTATNLSGGTVSATTGSFSGALSANAGISGTVRRGSYGSMSLNGTTGGYSGLDLYDQSATWMTNIAGGVSFGVYKSNTTWAFYFDANGTLQTGTIPGANVSGAVASATSATTATTATTANALNSSNSYSVVNLTASGTVTANSDERIKANWRPVQDDFVAKLANIKSGVYDRTDIDLTQAGVSAQSWQALLPETVQADEGGKLSVAYGNAALVAAVELAKEVVKLRAELEALKTGA